MMLFSSFTPIIEIAIIAIIFNYLLSFFWNTRSLDLLLGLLGFLIIAFVAKSFNLPILHKIVYMVANVAIVAIVVIFQPELRVALAKFGIKGKKHKDEHKFDKFLDMFTASIFKLSEKHCGALIVLENNDSISDFTHNAVMLNAHFSPELLETIFASSTPLHDGAVLIRSTTILAAGAILPLAEDPSLVSRSMGTRHRAALGASTHCDAVIVIVSEETGKVSVAREGVMTRGLKPDRFRTILRSIFVPAEEQVQTKKTFNLLEWLRR